MGSQRYGEHSGKECIKHTSKLHSSDMGAPAHVACCGSIKVFDLKRGYMFDVALGVQGQATSLQQGDMMCCHRGHRGPSSDLQPDKSTFTMCHPESPDRHGMPCSVSPCGILRSWTSDLPF